MIRFTSDELNKTVLAVIMSERPTTESRLPKESLAIRIFGHYNPTIDRKIRDAVTELTIGGVPICADSGAPGYYLARTYEEAERCIAELRSRSDVYEQKIDGIKRGLLRSRKPVGEAVQMRMEMEG